MNKVQKRQELAQKGKRWNTTYYQKGKRMIKVQEEKNDELQRGNERNEVHGEKELMKYKKKKNDYI